MLIAFHKPYGFLSQFTPEPGSRWKSLSGFGFPRGVYPIGRLDADSEGLLLLSDEPKWNARLLSPERAHVREYWAQVEGIPDENAMGRLRRGLDLGKFKTLPCGVRRLEPQPEIAPRVPPIRVRKSIPDCWVALELVEGKYHQARRMTAAVGHPTLRLIRVRVGGLYLFDGPFAEAGQWIELGIRHREQVAGATR